MPPLSFVRTRLVPLEGGRPWVATVAIVLLTACGSASTRESAPPNAAEVPATAGVPALPPDALRVTFLGTGAPRPSLERSGPMTLVEAGTQRVLVDPGPGLRERLLQAGSFELISGLDHVLVSHLHFDHTVSLPDLWLTGWLYGRRTPLVVEGPVGTSAMMRHFEQAFAWDTAYRIAVGVPAAGSSIEARDIDPGVVFTDQGLTVTAFDVEHMPIDVRTRQRIPFEGRTLGFRFDYKGRSLVLSGDTRPSDTVVGHAQGVDVLVHEVQVPSADETEEAKLANVSLSVHTEPRDAAQIFARARPRMAVYSHIIPPDVTEAQLRAATPYDGPLTVAHDLLMITIGDRIEVADRPRARAETFERSQAIR
ncbi:MAG: MBL fold metallo-hydrolase [Vicinamibacterales bacterium]